jgi:hypothetical protein
MRAGHQQDNDLSYELYREIAEELCAPVDEKLASEVRFELYHSKLVYLKNLHGQCFRAINQFNSNTQFNHEDLANIHRAIEVTKSQLRETVLENLQLGLSKVS